MLSGDSRCFVCLAHTNAKISSKVDGASKLNQRSYRNLIGTILSPAKVQLSPEPLHLCETCQKLFDDIDHHQMKANTTKDAVVRRYKNAHGDFAELSAPQVMETNCPSSAAAQPQVEIEEATHSESEGN